MDLHFRLVLKNLKILKSSFFWFPRGIFVCFETVVTVTVTKSWSTLFSELFKCSHLFQKNDGCWKSVPTRGNPVSRGRPDRRAVPAQAISTEQAGLRTEHAHKTRESLTSVCLFKVLLFLNFYFSEAHHHQPLTSPRCICRMGWVKSNWCRMRRTRRTIRSHCSPSTIGMF